VLAARECQRPGPFARCYQNLVEGAPQLTLVPLADRYAQGLRLVRRF
jgi:hypothetical protein